MLRNLAKADQLAEEPAAGQASEPAGLESAEAPIPHPLEAGAMDTVETAAPGLADTPAGIEPTENEASAAAP